MTNRRSAILFCHDDELGYERNRMQFTPGEGLALDETYRLAHLPLVAADHPRIIPTREGTTYRMGRHARVFSLVLPVPGELLHRSKACLALEAELRASPFARKIAWSVVEQRRDRLHATICGSLAIGEEPPTLDERRRGELSRLGPVGVELRGLFSGNVNVGRLYIRAYPERRDGLNLFREIQRIIGCRETDLYVVGAYNLTDDLAPEEASALDHLIRRWWNRPLLRFEARSLWLLGAIDDLVLHGPAAKSVPLAEAGGTCT
jgi:hypothetical protein